MKVIVDENLPPSWADFLQERGFDAIHWKDVGRLGDPDNVVFEYAAKSSGVIVTQDLDFSRLLALYGVSLPSVVQLRVDCPTPEFIGAILVNLLKKHDDSLKRGCLISVDTERYRMKLLPLR